MKSPTRIHVLFLPLILAASFAAGPALAGPPISKWIDLPAFRALLKKCINVVNEANPVFATDQGRAFFVGGGVVYGMIAKLYESLAAGYTPDQLCTGWAGEAANYTLPGADKNLFLREGWTVQAGIPGWSLDNSEFWKASRQAGGPAIEKVHVRPDEIDDPFDALAAYHRGNLLYVDVPEAEFAGMRGETGLGGIKKNRKSALVLQWLRLSDELPGVTISEDEYARANEIVFREILEHGIEPGNHWIDRALKKEFSAVVKKRGQEPTFWTDWATKLRRVGLGCHLAAHKYAVNNGGNLVALASFVKEAECFEEKVRFQIRAAKAGRPMSSLPAYYVNLTGAGIPPLHEGNAYQTAVDYLEMANDEAERMFHPSGPPLDGSYFGQPLSYLFYHRLKETGNAQAERFERNFERIAKHFHASEYWHGFEYSWVAGSALDSATLVNTFASFFSTRTQGSDDFFIHRWAEFDASGAGRHLRSKLEAGTLPIGRLDEIIRRKDPALLSTFTTYMNDRIGSYLRPGSSPSPEAEKEFFVLLERYPELRVNEENLRLLGAQIGFLKRAPIIDRLIDYFTTAPAAWAQLRPALSEAARVQFALRATGGELIRACLTEAAPLGAKWPLHPDFERFLAGMEGSENLHAGDFPSVQGMILADLQKAIGDHRYSEADAWRIIEESVRFQTPGTSIDLLDIYTRRFSVLRNVAERIDFWLSDKADRFPSARRLVIAQITTHPETIAFPGKESKRSYDSLDALLTKYGLAGQFEGEMSGNGSSAQITPRPMKPGFLQDWRKKCSALFRHPKTL